VKCSDSVFDHRSVTFCSSAGSSKSHLEYDWPNERRLCNQRRRVISGVCCLMHLHNRSVGNGSSLMSLSENNTAFLPNFLLYHIVNERFGCFPQNDIWRFRGRGDGATVRLVPSPLPLRTTAPSLWSDCEFLDNFYTVSVSFVLWLNHKICLTRLLVTVHVFCRLKSASKCSQTYHFGNNFSFWGRVHRFTTPYPLDVRRIAPFLLKSYTTL